MKSKIKKMNGACRELENSCRICLKNGSRNIFENSTSVQAFGILAPQEEISSMDRLMEKLRYVTMLKVSSSEISSK